MTNSSIKSINLEPGQRDIELKLGNHEIWQARVSIPQAIDSNTKLVLALHWYGPIGDHRVFANCLAFPALKNRNAVVIAPASENGQWLSPEKEKQLFYLIKRLTNHLKINKSNCHLLGYSNGAIGAWNMAKKHPEVFSKGIAISGIYDTEKNDVPFVWIHGTKDELFYVERIREMHSTLIKRDHNIQLIEVPAKGHYDACSYLKELTKAVSEKWFD